VFWEVKEQDRERHEKAADFSGYSLRVLPLIREQGAFRGDRENSFTVAVGLHDIAWYLGFPPGKAANTGDRWYRVELCALREEETPITHSRPFRLPGVAEPPNQTRPAPQNPLARLSGTADFTVIRSEDRKSRARAAGKARDPAINTKRI
jgi:hypothetical protein